MKVVLEYYAYEEDDQAQEYDRGYFQIRSDTYVGIVAVDVPQEERCAKKYVQTEDLDVSVDLQQLL